jgi:hypothetical protein
MTRVAHLLMSLGALAVLAFAAMTAAGSVSGCGPRPGQAPPLAPRPERGDPANSPLPTTDPSLPNLDAGTQDLPEKGPVAIREVPVPKFLPDGDKARNRPVDAGPSDGYSPPLPPIPDASLPDSRMEPHPASGEF